MMETIRIRKAGYPVRYTFSDFLDRYRVLLKSSICDPKTVSQALTSSSLFLFLLRCVSLFHLFFCLENNDVTHLMLRITANSKLVTKLLTKIIIKTSVQQL